MRNAKYLIPVLAASLLLGACAREKLRADFGNSTEQNVAAQTVDPAAATRDYPLTAVDGRKAEAAIDRYRKEKPESTRGKLVSDVGN